MNLLEDAIGENKEGIRLLRSGNSADALVTFQNAVALMEEAAVEHAENPCEILRTYRQRNDQACSLHAQEQLSEQRRPDCLPGLQNDVCYVYNRPFLITTPPVVTYREDLDAFVVRASTFLIFNFALACHQHGTATRSEEYLVRAAGLYRLALKSLSTVESTDDSMFPVLQCLSLNNLANLHFDRCDFRKSQGCLDLMHSILMSTDGLEVYLNDKEIEELMLNMVHMQPPAVAHAA